MPSTSADSEDHRAFDAVVLAGAHSARLAGADKAMVEVAGQTLLDRVVAGLGAAERVVVVGPQRALTTPSRAVLWREEQPPGGGPVAAFAAGLAATRASTVLLVAVDLPFIAGALVSLLGALEADAAADLAMLTDRTGRPNFLATAWRRSSALERFYRLGAPGGLPMRRLLDGLEVVHVADLGGWGVDCDTSDSIESARRLAAERPSTVLPAEERNVPDG